MSLKQLTTKQMQIKRMGAAFTLIELLMVVGIIGILALIGMVHFQEAHTRAKVSAAQNNLRVLATGLETYRVDYLRYPTPRPVLPDDPFGLLADHQLTALTTPIAYISSAAFQDPFGVIQQRSYAFGYHGAPNAQDNDLPLPPVVNANKSVLYYHYNSFANLIEAPGMRIDSVAIISIGPDTQDSFSVYAPFPESLPEIAHQLGIHTTKDTLYDPTNGVVSEGDIPRFTGALPSTVVP